MAAERALATPMKSETISKLKVVVDNMDCRCKYDRTPKK
jgi:hypothetical protein